MSQYDIDIEFENELDTELRPLLPAAAAATLRQAGIAGAASLTLLITGDERLQVLNRDFLGYDRPTDVLSFPAGTPLPGPGEAELGHYLGDIAISVPMAARQAAEAGHALAVELQLLVVHGVLHLLGHDHAESTEKAAMWAAQTAVLQQLGVALQGGDALERDDLPE